MRFRFDAACVCHSGLLRKSNEDNYLFFGKYLPAEHYPSASVLERQGIATNGTFLAIFDGVSGEQFGEIASHSAAAYLSTVRRRRIFEKLPGYLKRTLQNMNHVVFQQAVQMQTDRMGTTVVGFYMAKSGIWIYNVGDSRAFLLNGHGLSQISTDDTNKSFLLKQGNGHLKPRLIQYLGINPSIMRIVPHIAASEIVCGDTLLLCSDGLTDMLDDEEIQCVLSDSCSALSAAEALVQAALDHGGKDNITVIVCKFLEELSV